jgi:hypothetical protein
MPQPHNLDETEGTVVQRQCPECGLRMFLKCIEQSPQGKYEELTFECSTCLYSETVTRQITPSA